MTVPAARREESEQSVALPAEWLQERNEISKTHKRGMHVLNIVNQRPSIILGCLKTTAKE
jgi:hypothetical protein